MTYAQKVNDTWVELPIGPAVISSDLQASYETVASWSESERNDFGVYTIEDVLPVQEGKIAVVGPIVDSGGRPVRTYTLVDVVVQPDVVPDEVTAAQAQVSLYAAGLLEAVESKIANHPYPMIRIWWRAASNWRRDNPYVAGMAVELGLTDKQVDNLFIQASKIVV